MKSGRNHLPILDIGGGEDEDRVLAGALSDWREVEMRRRRILQTRLKGKMTEHYSDLKHAKWRLAEKVGKKMFGLDSNDVTIELDNFGKQK